MAELISKKDVIELWDKYHPYIGTKAMEFDDALRSLPIRETRNHGEWVGTEFDGYADGNPVYYEWICSSCGCVVEDEEPTWNFCPNCGADMREVEE